MMLVNCKNDELYFENQKQSKKTDKTGKNEKKMKNAVIGKLKGVNF